MIGLVAVDWSVWLIAVIIFLTRVWSIVLFLVFGVIITFVGFFYGKVSFFINVKFLFFRWFIFVFVLVDFLFR